MTIKQWLKDAQDALAEQGISSAALDSQLLLSRVLEQERAYLLSHPDQALPQEQCEIATLLLKRRLAFEPMAFILEQKEFFGLQLKTDSRALIPRGESETLVEAALEWLKAHPGTKTIAEVGTGSGAIILALAQTIPDHRYYATELSAEALALAQENAHRLNLNTITFLQGNLGTPLLKAGLENQVDVLITNLPYIPTDLLTSLDPTVTYFEPNLALDGGSDGLDLYRHFLPQAQQLLTSHGLMLLEHDFDQGEAMRALVAMAFPDATISIKQDYLGHDRAIVCEGI